MKARGIFAVMAAAIMGLVGRTRDTLRGRPARAGKAKPGNQRRKQTRGAFGTGPTGWKDR